MLQLFPSYPSTTSLGGLGISCQGGPNDGELLAMGNWGGDDRRWTYDWLDSSSRNVVGTVLLDRTINTQTTDSFR